MLDLHALTHPPDDYDPAAIQLPPLRIGPTLAEWEGQREQIRLMWLEYLGHGPEQVPLEPETYTQEDLGDVTRTLISYQVEDGCRVEAYLMLPKGDGPFPGIVVFHPTTNTTIEQPVGFGVVPQLQFGLNLARRGYATLSPRNYIWSYRDITASKWSEYARTAGFLLDTWPNWTGMGKMLWDGMRAVDYLLAVPGVDGARLGCIGHSLGAKEVLYAMAFDERLRAGISCEGGVGMSFTNWDAPWYLGKRIHKRPDLDHHQLLALAAPRALLVFGGGREPTNRPQGRGPGADGIKTWNYMEAARPAYELYGAADALGYLLHNQGHYLPPEYEPAIYDWFAAFMAG